MRARQFSQFGYSIVLVAASCAHVSPATAINDEATLLKISNAANAAVRGESIRARAILDPLPDSPQKSLILACVALDEGHDQEALDVANRLLTTNPRAADVQLLRTLAIERIQNPSESWTDATIRGMKTVRGNDAVGSTLIPYHPSPFLTTIAPIDQNKLANVPGLDGFLVRAAEYWKTDKEKVLAEARGWIKPDSPRVALLVAFAAFRRDSGSSRSTLAQNESLRYLLAQNPESAFLRFYSVMDGPADKPLADADLNNLGHALEGKDSWLPFREMYAAFEKAYAQVDPAQAAEAASSAVFDFYPTWSLGLPAQRAEATELVASSAARQKLGQVFEKLGDLFSNACTDLDRGVMVSSWAIAARLTSNEVLKKRVSEFRRQWKEEMHAPVEPIAVLVSLPLRSAVQPILEMKGTDEVGLDKRLRQ